MPDFTLDDALAEAYASAPADVVTLDTLEIHHPAFRDDDGLPTAIRVVNNTENIDATLEDDAPLNGGQVVTFLACGFRLQRPDVEVQASPELRFEIDNVDSRISQYVRIAAESTDVAFVIYRPYVSKDLSRPSMNPPLRLELAEVNASGWAVSAVCRFAELANRSFPSKVYTPQRFPGLVA